MSRIPKKLYLYIAKNFLIKFFNVITAIFLLVMIINLFDVSSHIQDEKVGWKTYLLMAALPVPSLLEDIAIFIIMLSAMLTLFSLSIKSEITIMRSIGLSLWQILFPVAIVAFILGIIFITFFNSLAITASKEFDKMEKKFIDKEAVDILEPANGIWLKQQNILDPNEFIIIRAKKIRKEDFKLSDVNLWFFNSKGEFYKKIDVKNMLLYDYYWQLDDLIINDNEVINQHLPALKILTNLRSEFITQKIINNFEDVKLFSIFELPKLITNLKESGFSSRKFKIYYYSLLAKPLMFFSMALIAAFFAINHIRNKNNILYFVAGIIVGLLSYISSSVINAFGFSGFLPPFTAVWVVAIIFLAVAILLVFRKENIS